MRVEGVIFDMDGVIFDSELIWKCAFEEANKRFGIDFTEDYRIKLCGKDERTIRDELRPKLGLKTDGYRDFQLNYVTESTKRGIQLKTGFRELYDYIVSKRIKIALATSSSSSRARLLFEKQGIIIDSAFDSCVFGENVNHSKPDPEIFIKAAELMNLKPSNCLVLEDSLNGIKAALSGGFQTIMVIDLIEPSQMIFENRVPVAYNLLDVLKMMEET